MTGSTPRQRTRSGWMPALAFCLLILSSAFAGCGSKSNADPSWPQGLPTKLRFREGREVTLEWSSSQILDRTGRPAAVIASSVPISDDRDLVFRFDISPEDHAVLAVQRVDGGEIWLEPMGLEGALVFAALPFVGFEVLRQGLNEGEHDLAVGDALVEVNGYGDIFDMCAPIFNHDGNGYSETICIRWVLSGDEVRVLFTILDHTPRDWLLRFTFSDFEPAPKPTGRGFSTEPIAEPLPFDRLPSTSPAAPYPLREALDRAAAAEPALAAFLSRDDWHARYVQYLIRSGLPGPDGGFLTETWQWNVELVSPTEGWRVEMWARFINGRAALDLQEADVRRIEARGSPLDARTALAPIDLVHEACGDLLPGLGGVVAIEYNDVVAPPFTGPPPGPEWAPWYGCGPNVPGNRAVVVEANTGRLESYQGAATGAVDDAEWHLNHSLSTPV